MNLVIDIGNTTAKYAVFENNEMVDVSVFSNTDIKELQNYISQYPKLSKAIFCSVTNTNDAILKLLESRFQNIIEFTPQTEIPLKITYQTPETLGPDRLAAAIGAAHLFPNKNILVVSMGTCITYEIITQEGEYLGGKISPGAQMRLKALNTFTAKLPLVELRSFNNEYGQSTSDSILAGVISGIAYEIEGTIDALSQRYANLQTILSGGDSAFFVKAIKKPIFTDPFLVLKGLNLVLNHHGK